MSISSSYYAMPSYSPAVNASQPSANAVPAQPSANATGYASSSQPVQAQSTGGMFGFLAGAAGGGFLSWKFLVPMFARTRSLPGLAVAGIIGAGALVGGWLSHKVFSNL